MAKTKVTDPRHRLFIEHYLTHFNATQAAGEAGFSLKNRAIGTKLLSRESIAQEIARRCAKIQAKLEVNADDVRRGLARIATDPREEHLGGPSFRDRILAWRELAKLFGMYTQKIQITGSITLVDLLLAADRKVAELPAAERTH